MTQMHNSHKCECEENYNKKNDREEVFYLIWGVFVHVPFMWNGQCDWFFCSTPQD